MLMLLAACIQAPVLYTDPVPGVRVSPSSLELSAPTCASTCCGLFGSACCDHDEIEVHSPLENVTWTSSSWDPLVDSRLRVNVDTTTCASPSPVRPDPVCEPAGSVEVGRDEPVRCQIVWDLLGEAIPACADVVWGVPCAEQPPIDGGYLTLSFAEGVAVSIYIQAVP